MRRLRGHLRATGWKLFGLLLVTMPRLWVFLTRKHLPTFTWHSLIPVIFSSFWKHLKEVSGSCLSFSLNTTVFYFSFFLFRPSILFKETTAITKTIFTRSILELFSSASFSRRFFCRSTDRNEGPTFLLLLSLKEDWSSMSTCKCIRALRRR